MKRQSVALCAAALLVILLGAAVLFPVPASAQAVVQPGVYTNLGSTGTEGGDKTLLTIAEDGAATLLFFNREEQTANIYPGEWLLDPYGTLTLELEISANESCSGEDEVSTLTLLPSPTGDVLTAVHYPSCAWGDGGLTLVRVADATLAEIETAYSDAGLLPGIVFQTEMLAVEDGSKRQLTLNLGQDDQALMITTTGDEDAPLVEVGEWTATVYTVTVTLTGAAEEEYDEPDVLTFGFLKDGTGRMAAYEYDKEKYGSDGVIMTYTPELPQILAAEQAEAAAEQNDADADTADETEAAPSELPGVYTSGVLPAADAPGLVQTLALFENGAVQLTSDFLNGSAPLVEVGTWSDNGDGTITVEITGTLDEEYDEAAVTVLAVVDGQLTADGVSFSKLPVTVIDAE